MSEKNPLLDLPLGSAQGGTKPNSSGQQTPLRPLSYDLFRKELLGLTDPERKVGESEKVEVREIAIRLCSILAHLFGDSLERTTLWSRIGTAFETAIAKVSDDDLDRLTDLCLEHVQADPGQAAACDALTHVRQTFAVRPSEWRHSLIAYLRSHRYAVLTHGRARWEAIKKKAVEL